jgi:hypothetical protein
MPQGIALHILRDALKENCFTLQNLLQNIGVLQKTGQRSKMDQANGGKTV